MINTYKLVFAASLLLALTACHQQQKESQSTAMPSQLGSVEANQLTSAAALLAVVPASMQACDPAAQAIVRWDVRSVPTVTSVEIFVGRESEPKKLFSGGGVTGHAQTGPWVRPGEDFILKDQKTGKVLADVKISGPQCP